jgi:predicted HTH domain antitoxin
VTRRLELLPADDVQCGTISVRVQFVASAAMWYNESHLDFGSGGWRMEAWKTKDLVSAGLYEDEDAVVQDAIRALLSERPQLRLELAIHRYRNEEISLAKAAALAGVSWERMREILLSRGVQPRLGPETVEEAYEEIQAMERIIREDPD